MSDTENEKQKNVEESLENERIEAAKKQQEEEEEERKRREREAQQEKDLAIDANEKSEENSNDLSEEPSEFNDFLVDGGELFYDSLEENKQQQPDEPKEFNENESESASVGANSNSNTNHSTSASGSGGKKSSKISTSSKSVSIKGDPPIHISDKSSSTRSSNEKDSEIENKNIEIDIKPREPKEPENKKVEEVYIGRRVVNDKTTETGEVFIANNDAFWKPNKPKPTINETESEQLKKETENESILNGKYISIIRKNEKGEVLTRRTKTNPLKNIEVKTFGLKPGDIANIEIPDGIIMKLHFDNEGKFDIKKTIDVEQNIVKQYYCSLKKLDNFEIDGCKVIELFKETKVFGILEKETLEKEKSKKPNLTFNA